MMRQQHTTSLHLVPFTRAAAYFAGLLLAVLFLAAPGCGGPKQVTFVLIDVSGSTEADTLRNRYLRDAGRIATTLEGGDWIVGDVITDASFPDAALRIDIEVPSFNPLRSGLRESDEVKAEAQAAFLDGVDALTRTPSSACTDLLGAFTIASRVLNGSRAASAASRRLVVFSDMVETCRHHFGRGVLREKQAQHILEEEQAAGRLPDLHGVDVWIAGAGTGGLTPEQIAAIEGFWTMYFEAAGARLAAERYGPTLLNWP